MCYRFSQWSWVSNSNQDNWKELVADNWFKESSYKAPLTRKIRLYFEPRSVFLSTSLHRCIVVKQSFKATLMTIMVLWWDNRIIGPNFALDFFLMPTAFGTKMRRPTKSWKNHPKKLQLGGFFSLQAECPKQPRTSFTFYKFFYPTISGYGIKDQGAASKKGYYNMRQ